MNELLNDLEWRGLLKDSTDIEKLDQRLNNGPITLYCGYDPTADSLHLGNLQVVMILRRFQLHGHKIIALAGGGTGLVGDPSGRTSERPLRDNSTVDSWTNAIQQQLKNMLPSEKKLAQPLFVNNIDWINKLTAVEFLRDIGKHFTVNYMLAKDSVSSRLNEADIGISFTEFSYMLLQALDFLELYEKHQCELQIGGSDQWGNITAGISLIGKKHKKEVHGLTSPLIMRSDGKKFGKSEGGAVWLDRAKTSPFAMYQYFLNIPDSDVISLMKRLTFLAKQEIDDYQKTVQDNPAAREAQRRLGKEVIAFVHGEAAVTEALAVTDWLFANGELNEQQLQNLSKLLEGAPSIELAADSNATWEDVLVESKLASSKSDARRLAKGGGISVWGERISDVSQTMPLQQLAKGNIIVLAKGKKNKTVIKLTD